MKGCWGWGGRAPSVVDPAQVQSNKKQTLSNVNAGDLGSIMSQLSASLQSVRKTKVTW